jgi:DNA-directed RNA polymerase specialized sigma24 family protein
LVDHQVKEGEVNKAQEAERKLVVAALQMGYPEIRKRLFIFYWPKFYDGFEKHLNSDAQAITQLYQEAFSRVFALTTGRRKNPLGKGTFLQGLFLSAIVIIQEKGLPISHPNMTIHLFSDSEIISDLVTLKQDRIDFAIRDIFGVAFATIYLSNHNININKERLLETEVAYPIAFMTLRKKLADNSFSSPYTATLFTYFYRIFEYKVKEINRENKKKEADLIFPEQVMHTDNKKTDTEYWTWLSDKIAGDRLFDFTDEASFVRFLLKGIPEHCKQLLLRHYIQGHSLESIGNDLNLPHPKMAIKRCRNRVKNLFNSEDYA